jgi:photosystem I P700 chlorophyll a apoprotein A2
MNSFDFMRLLRFHSDSFNQDLRLYLHQTNGRCATNKYFQIIGNIHDIESYLGIDNTASLNAQIFLCHWAHLAIIFVWVSSNLFHIGWNGNYELWLKNPIATIPIAHSIWDPHFALSNAYSSSVQTYSGIYNWLYTPGFNSVFQIYNFVIMCELLAVISIPLAKVHNLYFDSLLEALSLSKSLIQDRQAQSRFSWPFKLFVAYFDLLDSTGLRLNFHTGIIIGLISIGWAGHIVHVAIPISRGIVISFSTLFNSSPSYLYPFYTLSWIQYSSDMDNHNHIFRSSIGAGRAILGFDGGLKSNTISLYLTDIAHHHLALGILFVWASHVYLSLYFGFGHYFPEVNFMSSTSLSSSNNSSLHLNLSLALGGSCVITSVLAFHMYSLTPLLYLSYDYITSVALYVHHQYIASLLMMGTFAHAGIFLIRDYILSEDLVARILENKAVSISHLSWICLWLGFHTLALYIHNDTIVAFGEQEKQILIEPVFAQVIQESIFNIGFQFQGIGILQMPLGPGDFLVHHAIALGLHVTMLILLKGALDARGSKLMPDKIAFSYGFACDGPGRGGTCDISAWDSFYLATFWMLNTGAWITFYFHWKDLNLWQNTLFQFDESSTYLNGWFRDYLWFHSRPLIHGYNTFGANDLSIWAWAFLAAHLCWATGFMFLISWRGYWQELIDIILYMHLKTPILYNLWNGDIYTPVALSIVQARFIGLLHFSVGFIATYAAFIIGSTS